jgi:hypothetical protein
VNDIWLLGYTVYDHSINSLKLNTAISSHQNPYLIPVRLLDIDDFIENLWKIHVQVKSEGYVQVYTLHSESLDTEINQHNTAHPTRSV